MSLRAGHVSVLTLVLAALACTSAVPSGGGGGGGGGGYNSGYNSIANPRNNPCSNIRCQNGGYCDTLSSGSPGCVCPPGYSGSSCQNGGQGRNPCSNFRCDNGGRCDIDGNGRPHCHCTSGYYGTSCENREGPSQPRQSITNLRCDSACSTATSCRICLPCESCQYQTMCLAYEILVKSLDAECHAQGYQEALLMTSPSNPLGFSQIKCRGQGPIRECPEGSSCVDDGKGGGTCCRSRVGRDQLENKQGYCPARTDTQSCGRLSCRGDIDCAGNLKCCPLCGNKCTNPSTFPVVEKSRDPCENFRCQNGGRCTAPADAPYCDCPPGFTGNRCENREESCNNFRCLNGGRCVLQGGKPSCECPRDYRGPRCGIRDDPCRNFKCENGGRCVTRGDEPICQCTQGYSGPRCGLRNDPCQEMRCQNGGRCVAQGSNAPYCDCPRGFTGPSCGSRDVSRDPCLNFRCQNGGRCRPEGTTAYCECPSGYSGPGCENRDFQRTQSPCPFFGCDNRSNDQCGGCPSGWNCQYIKSNCINCPSKPTYRCVSNYKKK